MTKLAISGHRELPAETAELVAAVLRAEVDNHVGADLVGISCLADGADSLFARAVLDAGGSLVAVVPAKKYRDGFPGSHHATYDALLSQASRVVELDHVESDSEAYMDASLRMLDEADELIAVWDGQPARGYGGTADVVTAARKRGLSVVVVWPDGAVRVFAESADHVAPEARPAGLWAAVDGDGVADLVDLGAAVDQRDQAVIGLGDSGIRHDE